MATLQELVFAERRELTYSIKVNNVPLVPSDAAAVAGVPGVLGFEWGDSYDAGMAARIDLTRVPNWMRTGQRVTIDAGFNGINIRVFTGWLVQLPGEDPNYLRDKVIVRGQTVTIGTPPDTATVEINAEATLVGADIQPPLPDGVHIEHEVTNPYLQDSTRASAMATRYLTRFGGVPQRPDGEFLRQSILCAGPMFNAYRAYQLDAIDIGSFMDEDAIDLICDIIGIDQRSLVEPPDGWYQLPIDAIAPRGRPIDMLQTLQELGGLQAHEQPGGGVIFRYTDFAPAPSAAFTYDTSDPDTARVLSATGELELLFNPLIRKGMTGQFKLAHLNYDSRAFVHGVRHRIAQGQNPVTICDAWGGTRLGGTVEQDPIASFDFTVIRKVHGSELVLEYTCDASGSFDPNGTQGLTYEWTCNRITVPAMPLTSKVITFRVPATVATPLTLTLEVTSVATGLTHSTSANLPTSSSDPRMIVPALFASMNNNASASPDGGINFNDQSGSTTAGILDAKPADGVNAGICVYPFNTGVLKRTTDFCATPLTTVKSNVSGDGNFKVVHWDRVIPTRCWAGTSTGRLYRSDDDGVNWVLHHDFGGGYAIRRIATPLTGGVWCFGGRGDQTATLIQFEATVGSGTWTSIAVGGSLATALSGASSSVYVAAAASRQAGELAIILNGVEPAIHYTTNVFDPTGASWTGATGLTAGLTDGRDIVPSLTPGTFRAFFGDRDAWETANGVAYTQKANVLDVGFTPFHALWLGEYTGIESYLFAAQDAGATGAIYEWNPADAAAAKLRPSTAGATWPTSSLVWGLAIGASGIASFGGNLVVISKSGAGGTPRVASRGLSTWVQSGSPSANASVRSCLRKFGSNYYRLKDAGSSVFQVERSTDGCATWSNVGPTPVADSGGTVGGAIAIDQDAGGNIYILAGTRAGSSAGDAMPLRVWKSTDGGASFMMVYQNSTVSGGLMNRPLSMSAHPTNENLMMVHTENFSSTNDYIIKTIDAWASVTLVDTQGSGTMGDFRITSTGRIIFFPTGGTSNIHYSDDDGATWVDTGANPAGNTLVDIAVALDGAKAFMLFDTGGVTTRVEIWRTLDGGVTWTQILDSTSLNDARGLDYDRSGDTLYVATGGTGTSNRVLKIEHATTVSSATPTDVTENLDSVFTDAADIGSVASRGIVWTGS